MLWNLWMAVIGRIVWTFCHNSVINTQSKVCGEVLSIVGSVSDVREHLTAQGDKNMKAARPCQNSTIAGFIMTVISYLHHKWRLIIYAEPEHSRLPGNYTALDTHANILEPLTCWRNDKQRRGRVSSVWHINYERFVALQFTTVSYCHSDHMTRSRL